jgi:Protein of unknown function (DUF3830)
MRQIKLTFPEVEIEAIATLIEDKAPDTCAAVWNFLEKPLEATVRIGIETGPEIWFLVPPSPDLPNENSTVFPIPGDLLFYHYDGQLPHGEKVYDIGIYYNRGGKSLLNVGWTPGNLFATISENLSGVQKVAGEMLRSGPKKIIVQRVILKKASSQ